MISGQGSGRKIDRVKYNRFKEKRKMIILACSGIQRPISGRYLIGNFLIEPWYAPGGYDAI